MTAARTPYRRLSGDGTACGADQNTGSETGARREPR